MKKALQVVTSAYRCNLEEQDDPVVWITEAMQDAGADLDVLLEGPAVNYAARRQDPSGLSIGGKPQTQPPRLQEDVRRILSKGASVYVVGDDVEERGLSRDELVEGVKEVRRTGLPSLFAGYEQIWQW